MSAIAGVSSATLVSYHDVVPAAIIPDDAAVKNAVAVVAVLMLLAGCGAGSTGASAPTSASAATPTPVTSMCAKVSDDEVATALGVSGWHGQDVRQPGHDPSDVRCVFKGDGYEFEVRTSVLPGAVASADDALRVLLSVLPGQPVVDNERVRVSGLGDAAVYWVDPNSPLLDLSAVKRVGSGWRSLELSAMLIQTVTSQQVTLPKEGMVALAQKVMSRL